ncbi:MAG: FadR family transcriptional regulator [Chloroflexi bacterium]|nr:FadR family transcriptional regulator [Chloroflexota bacterium]
MIEPVKRSRIYEHIVQQIRALISDGSWAPGDQIPPERELAERFRVSRTSVREALRALEMQGVIESRQGGGTFVRSAEPELLIPPLASAILRGQRELGEVLEVCELLEPGVARYAALRATPEAVEELDAVLARQRASVEGDDQFVEQDAAFHATLARTAENRILQNLYTLTLELLRESNARDLDGLDRRQKNLRWHQQILEAVAAHDGDAAHAASLAHVSEMREAAGGELGAVGT